MDRWIDRWMNNTCCPCGPVCRLGNTQVLQFHSGMKIIRLMVEVTNFPAGGKLGEDAHQAMLNVTIPDALSYSGVRSAVRPLEGSRRLRNVLFLVISSYAMCFKSHCLHQYLKVASANSPSCTCTSSHSKLLNWILLFTFLNMPTVCSGKRCAMQFGRRSDLWAGESSERQWKGSFE